MKFEWKNAALRQLPPWLLRVVGGAVSKGIATPVDTEQDRSAEAIALRFPGGGDNGVVIHPQALSYLGRERRILRGPGETDETFAERLRGWWDAHRTRGGPYALLSQMHAFFRATNNGTIQYINQKGASVSIDPSGNFTRSIVPSWTGDGADPPYWARFYLVFFLPSNTLTVPLETEEGDQVLTEAGEPLFIDVSIYDLTSEEFGLICSVPHEWSAAHIDRIYILLVPSGGEGWGIPETRTWGDGREWGGGLSPVLFTC